MKKIIIIAAAVIVLAVAIAVILTISSGTKGQISGKYSDVEIGVGSILEFEGDTVTLTYMSAGQEVFSVDGTYKISNGLISFDFPNNVQDIFNGESTFVMEEDHIRIDGARYNKIN